MKILLINSPQFEFHRATDRARGQIRILPPLHLGYLAAVAERRGAECRILDLAALDIGLEAVAAAATSWQPQIVGISSTTISFPNALRVAQLVKQTQPETLVVLGGCHVTFTAPKTLNDHREVDVVVRGEGEETFSELLDCLEEGGDLSRVRGLSYRHSDGSIVHNLPRGFIPDLDALPWPARHLMQMEAYDGMGALFTSRGCPYACAFCAATAMSGHRYRCRQPRLIVDEMQHLIERYGCRHFSFLDDTFTALPNRLTTPVCQDILQRGLNVTFACASRADAVSPQLIDELRRAGCIAVHYGVETGSQQVLDRMNKRIRLDQVRDAVRWAAEAGLEVLCSIILGLPGETEETVRQMRQFLAELRDLGASGILLEMLIPFPGTDIYERPQEYGITLHETSWAKFNTRLPIISTAHLARERLRELYLELTFDLLETNAAKGLL